MFAIQKVQPLKMNLLSNIVFITAKSVSTEQCFVKPYNIVALIGLIAIYNFVTHYINNLQRNYIFSSASTSQVMKKNKLSNAPSPNTSPIPYRKSYNEEVISIGLDSSYPDITDGLKSSNDSNVQPSNLSKSMISPRSRNEYETIDKRKSRGGYGDDTRDPEYETIPADTMDKSVQIKNRLSSSSTAGIHTYRSALA